MAKVKSKKKAPAQILGLERMQLTQKNCRERAVFLRRGVDTGKFKGETALLARKWAIWYMSKANQVGNRKVVPMKRKKAAKKAVRKTSRKAAKKAVRKTSRKAA